MKSMTSKSGVVALALVALVIAMPAHAASVTWQGGTGAWELPGNWNTSSVPGPGDAAYIDSGHATITTNEQVGYLRMAFYGTHGDLTLDSGSLTANYVQLNVRDGSVASNLYVNGGDLIVNSGFNVGEKAGSTGLVQVNGGTVTVAAGQILTLGAAGHGTLEINDGVANLSRVDVGGGKYFAEPTGYGEINVNGGELNVQSINLGYKFDGAMTVSGGKVVGTGLNVSFYGTSSPYGADAKGTFTVDGSGASTISFAYIRFGHSSYPGDGKLVFKLDENGITTLETRTNLYFYGDNPMVDVVIAEDTPGGTYTLASADHFYYDENVEWSVALNGSARYYNLSIVNEAGWEYLRLEVDQMPEPVSVTALLMGSVGLAGYLRRRRSA